MCVNGANSQPGKSSSSQPKWRGNYPKLIYSFAREIHSDTAARRLGRKKIALETLPDTVWNPQRWLLEGYAL